MIETITLTGARHLSLPGAPSGRLAAHRRTRLIVAAVMGLLLLAVPCFADESAHGKAKTATNPNLEKLTKLVGTWVAHILTLH